MAKHGRKRQKTGKEASQPQPLGSHNSLLDDAEKDDEERRLEELLFGTPFVPSEGKGKGKDLDLSLGLDDDGLESVDRGVGKEMEGLLDSDLFYVDDGAPVAAEYDSEEAPSFTPSDDEASDSDSDSSGSSSGSESSRSSPEPTKPQPSKSTRASAWVDPADAPISVAVAPGDASHSRLAKLRDAPDETTLSGREYERRLRRQFEKINPEPTWASTARDKLRGKRRRSSTGAGDGSDEDESRAEEAEEDDFDHLLNSTSGVLSNADKSRCTGKPRQIPPTTLRITRLRDANQAAQASGCGEIKVVAFHPSANIPLLAVGSADRRLRLFNIDGHTSPLLQTLHLPTLPMSSTSATFHPLGNHILLTGSRPFYFVYDMQSGDLRKSERGLWGTTFNGVNDASAVLSRSARRGGSGKSGKRASGPSTGEAIETHAFSPNDGSLLAVAGRGGYIHMVDWKSGTGQVIGSMKMTSGVKGLWWGNLPSANASGNDVLGADSHASSTGNHLISLSTDSEVYIWDVAERRCVRRWKDEGGFRGSGLVLAGSSNGSRSSLSIGSNTGLVNVYGADSLHPSVPDGRVSHPKPAKTLGNLVNPITTLRYNADGQLLVMASKEKKDAMRLFEPMLTCLPASRYTLNP
ncbi:hypothetical protein HGRIS_007362 [Hohenbuehelia grisea]|uniref:WD40 repeat-like protein n=1 Tax=Hohenbuehelia grisea TaxID=104357 RepID=A0ABR3J4X4_9AGAR